MLSEKRLWASLADWTVTVTFRRWRRPRARAGSWHRTPAGVLAIDAVAEVDPAGISEQDARLAGFGSRGEGLGRPPPGADKQQRAPQTERNRGWGRGGG
jgi:hypothetical protein